MSGYIGNIPVPQATQTRDTFTATAGQTSFATSGYTPSFLDVFLNGVHLVNGTDYTATNGSDVVLTSGAADGDVLEVVAYSTYQVNSQNYTGGLTVDNDGATVLTVDRATSDGTIIDLQKDGSSVGSINSYIGDILIGTGDTALRFHDENDAIYPFETSTPAVRDAAINLGGSSQRFKDLYLSGGVYLGGTGAANYLDDYEEGTWTPTAVDYEGGTMTVNAASYIKIGRLVWMYWDVSFNGNDGSPVQIANWPYLEAGDLGDQARNGAIVSFNSTNQEGIWNVGSNTWIFKTTTGNGNLSYSTVNTGQKRLGGSGFIYTS